MVVHLNRPRILSMTHDATTLDGSRAMARPPHADAMHLALVQVWRREEPERVGEVLLLPHSRRAGPVIVGRGEESASWIRQRPATSQETGPLGDPKISRQQLKITPESDEGIRVENLGRGQLVGPDGAVTDACIARPGQTIGIASRAVFLVTTRPTHLPKSDHYPESLWPEFGEGDSGGLVGESPVAWRLREAIARSSETMAHTLVLGPSGSGKELVARALHRLSDRSSGPWVARNAAAIPDGLVSAELFGNRRGYPNPGTPERGGLVGAAHGGVLLLDEIGELSLAAQAALLRVLDTDGEYQRLGESRSRRSDLRVIGATNRPWEQLKPDFAARFAVRLTVPPVEERREDIPLLCRHLLRVLNIDRQPSEALMQALVLRAHHASPDGALPWPPPDASSEPSEVIGSGEREPDADALRHALAAHFGDREATAQALGLPNRFALYRLMKKHGVEV